MNDKQILALLGFVVATARYEALAHVPAANTDYRNRLLQVQIDAQVELTKALGYGNREPRNHE